MSAQTFQQSVSLPVAAGEAFAWHERKGAIDRLIPPWEQVTVLKPSKGITDGQQVILCNQLGPLKLRWVAEHCDYRPGVSFRDIQLSGPFRRWEHSHRFAECGPDSSRLEDHIEYEIPAGLIGKFMGAGFIRGKIERMFRYRHQTTLHDLVAHDRFRGRGPLRIAVSGSSGLIGKALVPFLTTGGHQVIRLFRHPTNGEGIYWDLDEAPSTLARQLDGVDAVIHLAGENIAARRWTSSQKRRLRDSRIDRTAHLARALSLMSAPPRVLISASAVGYYGQHGSAIVTEQTPAGSGFLVELAQDWEAATRPAEDAGIRVANARLGMVLTPRGGALAKLLRPFSMGLGGRVGTGHQWWSWISLDDAVGALHHLLFTDSARGPVNCTAPGAVTNREFVETLAGIMHRPALTPVPRFAMRWLFGEMSDELLMTSIRVQPERLVACDYAFRHPSLTVALQHLLGRS